MERIGLPWVLSQKQILSASVTSTQMSWRVKSTFEQSWRALQESQSREKGAIEYAI